MTEPNPYGVRNAAKLIGGGLLLYAIGVALYCVVDKEGELVYAAGTAYVLGSAVAGAGVGTLLSFGRNMAAVRVLCALIACVVGSIFGVVWIEGQVNPPPPPAPVVAEAPSAEDLALRARLEAMASAKIVHPSAIVTVNVAPSPAIDARIRNAAAPFVCPGECPNGVLLEAPQILDADGDRLQIWLRKLSPEERAALDAALRPITTP